MKFFGFLNCLQRKNSGKTQPTAEIGDSKRTYEFADFETAIKLAGHGRFQYAMQFFLLPCCITSMFTTTTSAFILPSATCDLNLSLMDKGVLNAIIYIGMITTGFFWGFFADTLGRKKLLIWGYLAYAVCEVISAFSQTFWFLLLFKFFGGLIMSGPFAVLMSYVNEFHGCHHRGRLMMTVQVLTSFGSILLPSIASLVLTHTWKFNITSTFIFHPWQLFLLVCTIPTTVSGLLSILFPESPKFLMSRGRNEEALNVLKIVYKINTGNSKDQYPVKSLINELNVVPDKRISKTNSTIEGCTEKVVVHHKGLDVIKRGVHQLTPMFRKPFLNKSIILFFMNFVLLLGLNSLRLWLPQLFAMVSKYEIAHPEELVELCEVIKNNNFQTSNLVDNRQNLTLIDSEQCVFSMDPYINLLYNGIATLCAALLAECLIKLVGIRNIVVFSITLCGIGGISLYFAKSLISILILSSIFISFGSLASTAILGHAASIFPTTSRTMIIALTMLIGRMGAILGNLVFPFLLSLGCLPPFLMVGGMVSVIGFLGYALPNVENQPLK